MKLNFSLLFVILSFSLFAKVDSIPESYDRELGMDASFVNNFLPIDLRLGLSNTYFFSYRKYKSPEKFKRMNLSFNLEGVFARNNEDENTKSFAFDANYRIGWGKRRKLYKNFDWLFGNDIVLVPNLTSRNVVISNFANGIRTDILTIAEIYRMDIGTGWFLGFQYQINDRFSLYTESNLLFWLRYRYTKVSSEDNPSSNSFSNQVTLNRSFALPNDITFFYRF